MGNFHCIPDSCARIIYRAYLPPVVRWRYEGEDWQEIEADDYAIEQEQPLTNFETEKYVSFEASAIVAARVPPLTEYPARFNKGDIVTVFPRWKYYTPIFSIIPFEKFGYSGLNVAVDHSPTCSNRQIEEKILFYGDGTRQVSARSGSWQDPCIDTKVGLFDFRFTVHQNFNRKCLPNECTFTVYKNSEVVYEEIRKDCPEVEQLPCRLSDRYKEIEIKKEAWLQRIKVRNQSIDVIFVSPLEAPLLDVSPLPENCLNIYNTYTLAPPLLSNFVPLPGAINPFQFIVQVCSAPACPPPEYEVICDCDCRECPPDTCAVACDGHVCCYDTSTGIAVESIPQNEYCKSAFEKETSFSKHDVGGIE